MKILHLSDLHIGLRLYQYDLKEDQKYLLDQIVMQVTKERPDAVVIAGDIYDKSVPSAEAVELFDDFITNLKKASSDFDMTIMMISGNHDSAQRVDCYRKILNEQNVYMVGMPPRQEGEYIEKVVLQDNYGPVNFYLLPFVKPLFVRNIVGEEVTSYEEAFSKMIEREDISYDQRNVLVSHQFFIPDKESAEKVERAQTEVTTVGNIDSIVTDSIKRFDYVALGHIHKPMKVGAQNIRYCGTPMAYSVSEVGQNKGILIVELGAKEENAVITPIPLTPLRQVRQHKGGLEEVLMLSSDDYVSVTLTDQEDLDTLNMQERLRDAFPHLLEIRREVAVSQARDDIDWNAVKDANPFDLFMSFYPDLDEDEKSLMKDVINAAREE